MSKNPTFLHPFVLNYKLMGELRNILIKTYPNNCRTLIRISNVEFKFRRREGNKKRQNGAQHICRKIYWFRYLPLIYRIRRIIDPIYPKVAEKSCVFASNNVAILWHLHKPPRQFLQLALVRVSPVDPKLSVLSVLFIAI